MNYPPHTQPHASLRQRGFTLVELLVVIAIIAILAAVLSVSISGAINAAKRARAGVIANQIQTSIIAYNTEYSVYPVVAVTGPTDTYYDKSDAADQKNLMWALCGNISAYDGSTQTPTVSNTRQVAYLTPKRSDVDTNGILINPFSSVAAPYYFFIAMDADYSGLTGDTSATKLPDFTGWSVGTLFSAAPTLAKGTTQGVAIWADCDPKSLSPNESMSKAPNFWIHTY